MHPSGGVLGFFKEILGRTSLPTVRECQHSLPFFGEHCNTLCPILRDFWVVWGNLGLLRKIRENSPSSLELLDSNLRSKLDLREYPQMMEKDPQPITRISKVVGLLQAYIMRPPHAEIEGVLEIPNL
jgi:hypothetical protein